MGSKRCYHDGCAAAHALNLIGERWALLIVREMLLGPKRFTDLRTGLPGISPNVLSQRLVELEEAGIVSRSKLISPVPAWVYMLTEWGAELETVIKQLGRWGAKSPVRPENEPLSVNSIVLSLRTMFDASAAADAVATYGLEICEQRFTAELRDGEFTVERGESAEQPDATITTDTSTLAELIYGGRDLDEAVAAGDAEIHGDRAAILQFLTLFKLPEPAEAAAVG